MKKQFYKLSLATLTVASPIALAVSCSDSDDSDDKDIIKPITAAGGQGTAGQAADQNVQAPQLERLATEADLDSVWPDYIHQMEDTYVNDIHHQVEMLFRPFYWIWTNYDDAKRAFSTMGYTPPPSFSLTSTVEAIAGEYIVTPQNTVAYEFLPVSLDNYDVLSSGDKIYPYISYPSYSHNEYLMPFGPASMQRVIDDIEPLTLDEAKSLASADVPEYIYEEAWETLHSSTENWTSGMVSDNGRVTIPLEYLDPYRFSYSWRFGDPGPLGLPPTYVDIQDEPYNPSVGLMESEVTIISEWSNGRESVIWTSI